ncbi:hypothetical protein L1987_18641 [Smallanthus sonchifolius]|uniref:Uncharacterized protein n=1 Tax=Smallanthus sonchifolius TaxID=185202 RepID=A0ACB9J1B8_9ASTR|nr:hypothetical protein L1987_18641 [Smallanthus sonchifolius]
MICWWFVTWTKVFQRYREPDPATIPGYVKLVGKEKPIAIVRGIKKPDPIPILDDKQLVEKGRPTAAAMGSCRAALLKELEAIDLQFTVMNAVMDNISSVVDDLSSDWQGSTKNSNGEEKQSPCLVESKRKPENIVDSKDKRSVLSARRLKILSTRKAIIPSARKPTKQQIPSKKPINLPIHSTRKLMKKTIPCTKKPVKQPISSTGRPVKQPILSTGKHIKKPIPCARKPIKQPISSTGRPVKQPMASIERPVKQPILSTRKPINKPIPSTGEPVNFAFFPLPAYVYEDSAQPASFPSPKSFLDKLSGFTRIKMAVLGLSGKKAGGQTLTLFQQKMVKEIWKTISSASEGDILDVFFLQDPEVRWHFDLVNSGKITSTGLCVSGLCPVVPLFCMYEFDKMDVRYQVMNCLTFETQVLLRFDSAHGIIKHYYFLILHKNHIMRSYQKLEEAVSPSLALLTGIPLQDNLGEMHNLLDFLHPVSFPSPKII